MDIFLIGVGIFNGIILWMINKWALRNNAKSNYIGAITGLAGTIILIIVTLLMNALVFDMKSIIVGVIQGVLYAVGFFVFILHSLKIGPTGLTATINNLGMIFPVLLEILYFRTVNVTTLKYIALFAVFMTFLLLAVDSYLIKDKNITKKWLSFVIIGWIFTGGSMSMQTIASQYNCDANIYSLFSMITMFLLMLVISLIKEKGWPNKHDILGGTFNGYVISFTLLSGQIILETIPANIYFPLVIASPIIAVMFLNQYVFKEKSSVMAWIAATFGVVGIVLLTI